MTLSFPQGKIRRTSETVFSDFLFFKKLQSSGIACSLKLSHCPFPLTSFSVHRQVVIVPFDAVSSKPLQGAHSPKCPRVITHFNDGPKTNVSEAYPVSTVKAGPHVGDRASLPKRSFLNRRVIW
jgi:hypothetical protein